jgi:hypothetical protein
MTDGQRETEREAERDSERQKDKKDKKADRQRERKDIKIIKTCLYLTNIIARNFVKVCEDFSVDNADLKNKTTNW